MKRILTVISILSFTICGCQKQYNYNRKGYINSNLHYVERCDYFISQVKEDKNCDIVFVGDSITEGFPLHIFFNEYKSVNRGINGDTTGGILDRLEFSVYDLKPKVIYLMIGTNNLYTCLDNYATIVQSIKKHCPKSKLMLASITPRWGDEIMEKIRQINHEIEKYAGIYGDFYANVFTPLTENNGNLKANDAYFQDGLHPNVEGYSVITNVIKSTISEWLK